MKTRLKPIAEQVMVILGASSGIGLATARLAAARGARLVLVDRTDRALAHLVNELGLAPGRAVAIAADVTSEDDMGRVADEARRAFGGFDTWVNNAEISAYGACLDGSMADMRRIMDTNFWGLVHGARFACVHLRRRGGALINLGSIASDRGVALQGIYAASKHAIQSWTDSLRAELAHEGAPISVALIKPGSMPAAAVAKAVLQAAERPCREISVGGVGNMLSRALSIRPRMAAFAGASAAVMVGAGWLSLGRRARPTAGRR
jgi:short-subunit dehydrogenase